jgi:hypothetical protein
MKISFIAENDWANVLTEYSYCLNKHGENIESKSICFRPHPFNYKIQHDYDLESCSIEKRQEVKKFLEESDIIIFGEEGHPLEPTYRTLREFGNLLGLDLFNSNKKLCIWHPGSHYRQNYNFYNNHPLRGKIYKHLYSLDLYKLSNYEENDLPLLPYQYFNFNYEKFITNFKKKLEKKPWTILHIPTNSNRKGTNYFNSSIDKLKLNPSKYVYKTFEHIPNHQVLEEKSKSIFYLDQFNNAGSFGVASLEGLFNSNFTFSVLHNATEAIYKLTGELNSPIVPITYNLEKLDLTLKEFILDINEEELIEYMEKVGVILEKWYHPNNIVNNFKNIINE